MHASDLLLLVLALVVLAWVLMSARLGQLSITAPMAFVAAGTLIALLPGEPVEISPTSGSVRLLVEYALVFVLFCDASRVSLTWLRDQAQIPGRLLLLGLPLTIAAGIGIAWLLFPSGDPWIAAVIGAALAPTDAALGSSVMTDKRVPQLIRRVLNVESGLNDGIVTPFVLFFIAAALATVDQTDVASALATAGVELIGGVVLGMALGWAGARLISASRQHRWMDPTVADLAAFPLPVIAYAGAVEIGVNGFVAAFVSGLAFGNTMRSTQDDPLTFAEDGGSLLSLVVWFLFGAVAVPNLVNDLTWQVALYALLSLTVVRMVPVLLVLIGSGVSRKDDWVIAWLGPRGLASVVFALLALDALGGKGSPGGLVVEVVGVTVLLSIVLHGVTAAPIARSYARTAPAGEAPEMPVRRGVPVSAWLRSGDSKRPSGAG
ncbi:MAG: cation:proton antiporter [Actinomycetes bacterium]